MTRPADSPHRARYNWLRIGLITVGSGVLSAVLMSRVASPSQAQ